MTFYKIAEWDGVLNPLIMLAKMISMSSLPRTLSFLPLVLSYKMFSSKLSTSAQVVL